MSPGFSEDLAPVLLNPRLWVEPGKLVLPGLYARAVSSVVCLIPQGGTPGPRAGLGLGLAQGHRVGGAELRLDPGIPAS